jgi:ABC-type enterochelin transport system substrate-binding protein
LKRFLTLILVLTVSLLSGCGSKENENNAETSQVKEEQKSEETASTADAVEPNQAHKEIEFKSINWIMGAPDPEPTAGIWVYNKDKHPSSLDNQDWDHEDMLYVQASKKYKHQQITIKKLQVIENDVIKIIVSWEKDIGRELPPRDYVTVETGALDGKKFIVEDMDGQKVDIK